MSATASAAARLVSLISPENSSKNISGPKSKIFEKIAQVETSKNILLGITLVEPGSAELVILSPLVFITQYRIGLADFLEFFFRGFVALVAVVLAASIP